MLDTYINFINQHITDDDHQKILLAISGGVDSMVMLDLSIRAKHNISVAHVNHGIREEESLEEERLVQSVCDRNGITYHVYRFDDNEKSLNNFQEKAREIRYNWWNDLCITHGYSYICTAHHKSDSVETFFLNLSRGSGIKGLTGIPIVNQNILRPLLTVSQEDILAYSRDFGVAYKGDSSNASNKYKRNSIRNEWIPFLKSKEPFIEDAIFKSIVNLSKEKKLLIQLVRNQMDEYIENKGIDYQLIRVSELSLKFGDITAQLLYQYLRQYGFSEDSCEKCIQANVGSEFYSISHEMLCDRNNLILRKKGHSPSVLFEINDFGCFELNNYLRLSVSDKAVPGSMELYNLRFPFTIRTKQNGDRFNPAGMNGASQKLKDFLTNAKLDKWSKQTTLVIISGNEIAAVLPLRVAHGYQEGNSGSPLYISLSLISK